MAESSSSTAVIVVVVVVVLLLLLAFFWCGCGSGCGSSCGPLKLSKSLVPFSAGGLITEGSPTALSNLNYVALGDGNSSSAEAFSGVNTAGSKADQFASAFTRSGQVRKLTVHARLNATSTAAVTVGLYISPKASDQPAFALAQSVTFDATTTTAYFYAQSTAVTNVQAGDRFVVLVTSDTASAGLFSVGGSFEFAQCA